MLGCKIFTNRADHEPLGKETPQEYIKALGSAPVKVSPLNPADAVEY
jgi:hypothetical protein